MFVVYKKRRAMKNIFKNLTVKHVQLEEGSKLAELEVQFIQGKILIETILMLTLTDLNQLFARFNSKGVSLSLSDDFENYSTEDINIYSLDFCKKGWDDIEIDTFVPQHEYRQIRA